MEPPGLVQLEREVDLQIERYNCGLERLTCDLLLINDEQNPKPNELEPPHSLTHDPAPSADGDECQSAARPFIEDEASRDESDKTVNNQLIVAHINRSVSTIRCY